MDEEQHVEFDFSKKSNEEVLSLFFHEIRASVSSIAGYLSMLKAMNLPEEDARKFIDNALNRALFVHEHVKQVFEYLDEQRKD